MHKLLCFCFLYFHLCTAAQDRQDHFHQSEAVKKTLNLKSHVTCHVFSVKKEFSPLTEAV